MGTVIVDLAVSLDGFSAGSNESAEQPLGEGGMRLFDWYFDGDTPSRYHEVAASPGVPVPPYRLSGSSAKVFEELIENAGAVATGPASLLHHGWVGRKRTSARPSTLRPDPQYPGTCTGWR
jgi:hypothetical protein